MSEKLIEDRIAEWFSDGGEVSSKWRPSELLLLASAELRRLRATPSPREDAVWAAAYAHSSGSDMQFAIDYADRQVARLREALALREACPPQGDDGTDPKPGASAQEE